MIKTKETRNIQLDLERARATVQLKNRKKAMKNKNHLQKRQTLVKYT